MQLEVGHAHVEHWWRRGRHEEAELCRGRNAKVVWKQEYIQEKTVCELP
jgi:hypothetical protein